MNNLCFGTNYGAIIGNIFHHNGSCPDFYIVANANATENHGIGTNKHYPIPMHLQDCYKDMNIPEGALPVAEEISSTELSIPMYYGMTDEQVRYVIDAINGF